MWEYNGFQFPADKVDQAAKILQPYVDPDKPEQITRLFEERPDIADQLLFAVTGRTFPIPGRAELQLRYDKDPVGFTREVLREYVTPDCENLMRAVANHSIVAAQSCNGAGKSWSSGALALWGLLCHEQSQVYLVGAGNEDQMRRILWQSVATRVGKKPGLMTCAVAGSEYRMKDLSIQWYRQGRKMDSFLQGVVIPQSASYQDKQTKISGLHAPFLMFIMDEADAIEDPIFDGIETCLSNARIHLVMMFNPKKQSGRVFEMITQKRAHVVELSAFRHPNVIEGREVIPGAVSRDVTVRRMAEWSVPTDETGGDTFEVPDFLVGEKAKRGDGRWYPALTAGRRKITDTQFSPVVLGEFSPIGDDNKVFNCAYLNGLLRLLKEDPPVFEQIRDGIRGSMRVYERPRMGRRYCLCADPAEGVADGDYSVADVVDLDNGRQVAHYSARCDVTEFAADIASIAAWYSEAQIMPERNNHGHALVLALREVHEYDNIYRHSRDDRHGYPITMQSKAWLDGALEGMFNDAYRGHDIPLRIYDVDTVTECIGYVRFDNGERGAAGKGHDDCVATLRLVLEAVRQARSWQVIKPQSNKPITSWGDRQRRSDGYSRRAVRSTIEAAWEDAEDWEGVRYVGAATADEEVAELV